MIPVTNVEKSMETDSPEYRSLKRASIEETKTHIGRVQDLLDVSVSLLKERGRRHDRSKLNPPEVDAFVTAKFKLRDIEYGSPEYMQSLKDSPEMKEALSHHYRKNDHHPQFFSSGIKAMGALQLIEMLSDWKAAGERHKEGSLEKSLLINRERFNISPVIMSVLCNTAHSLGWATWARYDIREVRGMIPFWIDPETMIPDSKFIVSDADGHWINRKITFFDAVAGEVESLPEEALQEADETGRMKTEIHYYRAPLQILQVKDKGDDS